MNARNGEQRARIPSMRSDAGDALQMYLTAIAAEPLLTKEEEVELAQQIEECHEAVERLRDDGALDPDERRKLTSLIRRGERARTRFIAANLRLVVSIAKRYQNQGMSLLDVIQEGNLGLIRAVEKYDWRRGFKFSTYATWWIRQAIQRGLGTKARTIRIPVHVEEQLRKIRRVTAQLDQRLGRAPTLEEIAGSAQMDVEELRALMRAVGDVQTVSLHHTYGEDDIEFHELLADVGATSPVEEAEESIMREDLTAAMTAQLNEREREVLSLRFGLRDGKTRSLQQIGDMIGLSRERVRQIERNALEKLRREPALSG